MTTRPPLLFTFIGDEATEPPKTWVVPGVLARGEVAALIGPPFAGKSAVAARLASDVTVGAPFLGRRTNAGGVLFVAAERAFSTRRRLAVMRHPGPAVAITAGPVALADPASIAAVVATVAALESESGRPVSLVVLDTLAAVTVGLEENSARDMGRAAAGLSQIASAGPAVLVVHHVSKMTGDLRGSSAIAGAVDTILTLGSRGSASFMRVASANDGPTGLELFYRLEERHTGTDPETGETITTIAVVDADHPAGGRQGAPPRRSSDKADRALDAIRDLALDGTTTRSAVLADLRRRAILTGTADATRIASNRILDALAGRGLITRDGENIALSPNNSTNDPDGEQNTPNALL